MREAVELTPNFEGRLGVRDAHSRALRPGYARRHDRVRARGRRAVRRRLVATDLPTALAKVKLLARSATRRRDGAAGTAPGAARAPRRLTCRRGSGAVERGGLESRRAARLRGFESHPRRSRGQAGSRMTSGISARCPTLGSSVIDRLRQFKAAGSGCSLARNWRARPRSGGSPHDYPSSSFTYLALGRSVNPSAS